MSGGARTVLQLHGLLRLAAIAMCFAAPSVSAEQTERVPGSDYASARGEQFFLLADSSFGSDEQARVRLEAPGRDYRRYEMETYGGADVRVYRIEQPLQFLQRQKNLHRVQVDARYRGEGLSNTLAYLWDHWYKQSRRSMQRVFSAPARKQVTAEAPALKTDPSISEQTRFEDQPQYAPLSEFPLISEFRYPLWDAQPIAPPDGVNLPGSSSEFIAPQDGNVYIPLGKLAPGLYLVEALVGRFRASTVVFVSNSVAITKIAGDELLIWTARKREGTPVAGAQLLWSDGVGVLTRGSTDGNGLLRLTHRSPERSYVLGEDAEGGVFVSENFYYDSEIYDTKLYAVTDRPLYRPGDWVELKIVGREFKDARRSVAAASAPIELSVIDANGSVLQTLDMAFDSAAGADSRFQLPANATAGGYELRFAYRGQLYSSAFRVAEYIKPHFEIALELEKSEYRSGEPVNGQVRLLYPDGKPVRDARIEVSLRAQQLSMVDNELQYLGQFPVELQSTELRADAAGLARLELPAADKPSRYLLTLFASDGAAYRVKTSKEILIERGAAQYRLSTGRQFSSAGETVKFSYALEGQGERRPSRYEWLRLQDRSRGGASLAPDKTVFDVAFERAGTYNISLLDEQGMILGATGHDVSGDGVKASPGSIEIVLDHAQYRQGDTAEALITFPEPVDEALLTLERDRVEASALLSGGGSWLQLKRLNETQWQARIPVEKSFAPNLTFSVLYTRGGDYSFQNAGIRVEVPSIDIAIRTDREVYRPGEKVTVELQTTLAGKATPARLSVAVVDEMIYALQPEIAPAIGDFFYHPRRNNVRTSASLSFISYDVALPGAPTAPGAGNRSERAVKVLERPRREDVDTAAWQPKLLTDSEGRARFSFVVPDSLTRWRITARAMNAEGVVGQRRQFLRSEQALYLKWSGPTRFRDSDRPTLGVLAFNQGDAATEAELLSEWNGEQFRQSLSLPSGVSYHALPALQPQTAELQLSLRRGSELLDKLAVKLRAEGDGWQSQRSEVLDVTEGAIDLRLPADASQIELRLASGANGLFRTALDDLLDYPWGCVEQTASRLLPLSLAFPHLADEQARVADRLRLIMQGSRLRLMQMAGPEAHFSWWGEIGEADAFLTAYAYYADWHASRALGIDLPAEHWQRVLSLYSEQANQLPLLQRVLVLDFAATMQLPVKSLLQGAMPALQAAEASADAEPEAADAESSLIFSAVDSTLALAAAQVLAAQLAVDHGVALPTDLSARIDAARDQLRRSELPFARAVLLRGERMEAAALRDVFAQLAPEQATIERALVLTWLQRLGSLEQAVALPEPGADWQLLAASRGAARWQWVGASTPVTLALSQTEGSVLSARVAYFSADAPRQALPVQISRRLFKLVPGEGSFNFKVEPVSGSIVDSSALYLDEITVSGGDDDRALRYGLIEVPLPPGADVERTTWGIQVSGLGGAGAAELEKARHEMGELRYALPIDTLSGELRFRHLLRFSQKGQFTLPPVRYQRMYAPDQQAWETDPALSQLTVK